MAVTVVLYHAGLDWIWNIAVTGVTFFFLSSAFLLAMKHPFDSLSWRDYRSFVSRHAMRIYPLHWLGLAALILIALVYNPSVIDWGATALSALLLQSWSPVHDVHYCLNPVAWYMSALVLCYLAYPLIARCFGRWRWRYKLLLAAGLTLVLGCILVPLDIPGREAVFVNPLAHVVDVTVGLMLLHLYHVLRDRYPVVSYRTATLIEVGAILLLALVITINVTTTWLKPWEDVIIWFLPQGAVLLSLALLNGQEGAVGRLLLSKPLQWLGKVSFEVYVLQFVAFMLFNYWVAPFAGHYGINIYDKLAWFVFPLLLPLSWLVNRYFTRPLSRLFNR